MPPDPPRSGAQRRADALAQLTAPHQDVWVATASPDADAPHLVPLSLAWVDEQVVIALEATSVTARNIAATGRARLAVGPTRDVVVIDAHLAQSLPAADAGEVGQAYVRQAEWDPRQSDGYLFLVLAPRRIQAWREANEIVGRTIMRDGAWLG
ncbi:pyridoxamine 5'-phosphate oxidase family protein [Ornithinicoccus halotolerans]|uniref:pyridoxamine 5'-phosphate oxidase family protein n=1 Tax=Ornithinicoccus halotolerans TaxID=1748220 RepID=UPI001296E2B7|nr:pyridoxamine 5'-phosphate oxidase family protein [Ornithinicoccus halotolerans]